MSCLEGITVGARLPAMAACLRHMRNLTQPRRGQARSYSGVAADTNTRQCFAGDRT